MTSTQKTSKTLNIFLWIAQVTLSIGFLWAAANKLLQPADTLAEMWPWTAKHLELVKITGMLDLLAGTGLVLPALIRFQPKLTVYAAMGTVALMIAASIFHLKRGEADLIGVNLFFGFLALFVVWGRTKKAPILPKY